MNEFLKKLNDSLSNGSPDDEILSHHYEILKTIDVLEAQVKSGGKDRAIYENEVLSYLSESGNTTQTFKTSMEVYIDKVVESQVVEDNVQKKDLIESNTEQIRLLTDEIEQLNKKIAKNLDLIEFLKFEMTRK